MIGKKTHINALKTLLFIFTACLIITGCKSSPTSESVSENSDNPYRSYIYSNTIRKQKPTIDIEEYVSRVGKKVILVSDYPDADYSFKVSNSNIPIEIRKDGNIVISKNALLTLQDEAELAAILAQAINKINNNFKISTPETEDKEVISVIGRAGYDPSAVIDLQERYVDNPGNENNSWVSSLSEHKINRNRINKNKQTVSKSPKGLRRNKHTYINIVINS